MGCMRFGGETGSTLRVMSLENLFGICIWNEVERVEEEKPGCQESFCYFEAVSNQMIVSEAGV